MSLEVAALEPLIVAFLQRQPWFAAAAGTAGDRPALVRIEDLGDLGDLGDPSSEHPRPGEAGLARVMMAGGQQRYQLIVGWRAPTEVAAVLGGREGALMGPVRAEDGVESIAYDALADTELCLRLLGVVTGGTERAERVRTLSTLVSHASLVFDERLLMKCYRVLHPGTRPEIELMYGLDEVGFNAMLAPVARWQGDGYDLALVREFVADSIEGRELALTSLRDLLAHGTSDDTGASSDQGTGARPDRRERPGEPVGDAAPPEGAVSGAGPDEPSPAALSAAARAGGDLAAEMTRLGAMTAGMHVALTAAFGEHPVTHEQLLASLDAEGALEASAGTGLSRLLAGGGDLGTAIRLHGDYHLRRVMRSEVGWLVAGFGDDPIYGEPAADGALPERRGTPLEDLADLCAALRTVAGEALARRPHDERGAVGDLAAAWIRRNREAVLAGYRSVPAARRLLPEDPLIAGGVLDAFEGARTRRHELVTPDS